jgi:hypothetical protein
MSRYSIRLAVALVTFVVGLKLAWVFAALFSPALTREEVKGIYVAPPAARVRSCPSAARVLGVPEPPSPPAPPAAAEPPTSKQTRIVIRGSDGTVQVIETHRPPKAKDKF